MNVSAVLVTRGNVDVGRILVSFAGSFDDVVVWDNSVEDDLAVYGRYAAIERCRHDVIYVQDDDCVLDPPSIQQLLDAYEPGAVTSNMTEWHQTVTVDSALVGFGAVFDRALPALAFGRYLRRWHPEVAEFLRTCDVVFTAMTPRRTVDAGYRYLPWSSTPDRMWKQPSFHQERSDTLDRARMLA